jgi:hypothetical protein
MGHEIVSGDGGGSLWLRRENSAPPLCCRLAPEPTPLMFRCRTWAVRSSAGDAAATLAAIDAGLPLAPLADALAPSLLTLAQLLVADGGCDLVLLASTKGDLPRWLHGLLTPDSGSGQGGPAALAESLGAALGCPAWAVDAACAGGLAALLVAVRALAAGRRRVLILGGERLHPFIDDGFRSLGALAAGPCRPYDRDRDGLRLGALDAAILLESGPGPGVILSGWGASCDASHRTAPAADGAGLAMAVTRACGGQLPAWIIGHGTGTMAGDAAESAALQAAGLATQPLTGWKGVLGHGLGGGALAETALALELLATTRPLPGCAGCRQPLSPAVLAPGEHPRPAGAALKLAAGFGGLNGAVLLGGKPQAAQAAPPARVLATAAFGTGGLFRDGQLLRACVWDGLTLPAPSARTLLGHSDPLWGRLEPDARCLAGLAAALGPWPTGSAIVVRSRSLSAATDRRFEQDRRAGVVARERFPATLATAAAAETARRQGCTGPLLAVAGLTDVDLAALAAGLLAEGAPAVLTADLDDGLGSARARAQRWEPA